MKFLDALIEKIPSLFSLLEVILGVGLENVVQVIIDNAIAYISTMRFIKGRYPSIDWIKDVVEKAKNITKYVYNHA